MLKWIVVKYANCGRILYFQPWAKDFIDNRLNALNIFRKWGIDPIC